MEKHIGFWGVCSRGRIGKIWGQKELDWGLSWIGTGLDGLPWASRNPTLILETDGQFLDKLVASG